MPKPAREKPPATCCRSCTTFNRPASPGIGNPPFSSWSRPRELADQVQQVFQTFIPALAGQPVCMAVTGGVSINPQMLAIGRADILIATPGRLLELLEKNAVRLSSIAPWCSTRRTRCSTPGFKEELDRILALLPRERQNLLFPATLNYDVSLLQRILLHDPQVIRIADEADEIDLIHELKPGESKTVTITGEKS